MKRADIIRLIGICSMNYRNFPEEGKEEALTLLWMKMFGEMEYFVVEAAIEKYLVEGKFPPTIADIMQRIADITVVKEKTAIEGWDDVKTAIRKFGFYRKTEAMGVLTGTAKKVVEAIGFDTICMSENEMADRAHFLKVYDTLAARERSDALMLPSTRNAIERLHGEEPNGLRRIK